MTGAAHSKTSRVFVNDVHGSGSLSGWTVAKSAALSEATGLDADGATTTVGIVSGQMTLAGYLDTSTTGLTAVANAAIGVDDGLLVTVTPVGTAVGQPMASAVCDEDGLTVDASVSETVASEIQATANGGLDWGVVLHAHTAETATGNGVTVDSGAATANGGVGVLHVTAYTGLTGATVKIQHSTDNSTWADLATFTAATTTTWQKVLVAAGTTVNRYLRATVTAAGTGSVTYLAGFCRR